MKRFFFLFLCFLTSFSCSDGSLPFQKKVKETEDPYDLKQMSQIMSRMKSSKKPIVLDQKVLVLYGTLLSALFGHLKCRTDLKKHWDFCSLRYEIIVKHVAYLMNLFTKLLEAPPHESGYCHLLKKPQYPEEFMKILFSCGDKLSEIFEEEKKISLTPPDPSHLKDQVEEDDDTEDAAEGGGKTESHEIQPPLVSVNKNEQMVGIFQILKDLNGIKKVPGNLIDQNHQISYEDSETLKSIRNHENYETNRKFYEDLKKGSINRVIVDYDMAPNNKGFAITNRGDLKSQAVIARDSGVCFYMHYPHVLRLDSQSKIGYPVVEAKKLPCTDEKRRSYFDIRDAQVRKAIYEVYKKDYQKISSLFCGYVLDENLGFEFTDTESAPKAGLAACLGKTEAKSALTAFASEWNDFMKQSFSGVESLLLHRPLRQAEELEADWTNWKHFDKIFIQSYEHDYFFDPLKNIGEGREAQGMAIPLGQDFSQFPYCSAVGKALTIRNEKIPLVLFRKHSYASSDLDPYLTGQGCKW